MKQTPILIDLDLFVTQPKRDIVLPSETEIAALTTPILLSPKLTIKIYPPEQLAYKTVQTPLVYHVPSHGFLKDKVRLSLPPCEGYGINACYRVEYWSWQPVVSGVLIKPAPKIASRLVRTDYWLVPSLNPYTHKYYRAGVSDTWGGLAPGEFKLAQRSPWGRSAARTSEEHLHYEVPVRYYEPFWGYSNNAQLLVLRSETDLDNSFRFTSPEVIQLAKDNPVLHTIIYSQIEALTLFPDTYYTNEVVVKELQLQWLTTTTPLVGELLTVSYVRPVGIEDIYFVNHLEERRQGKIYHTYL